jgi:hypothetical protein
MINQIFKDFYTEDEYKQLTTYVEDFAHRSKNYGREFTLGRYYGVIQDNWKTSASIGGFPNNLLTKVKTFAEDHFGIEELNIFDIIIIRYCTDYGFVPKLDLHKDGGALTKYTVDYQYSSNIDWPVVVEEKEFLLNNNDALTFIGTKQLHGRRDRIFSNEDYVENIFFQFTEKRR